MRDSWIQAALGAILATGLLSCSVLPKAIHPGHGVDPSVAVEIGPGDDEAILRVRWNIDPPVDSLSFPDRQRSFRHLGWKFTVPGFEWTTVDGQETIRRKNGEKISSVAVEIDPDQDQQTQQWIWTTSDGGWIAPSSLFHVCPSDGSCNQPMHFHVATSEKVLSLTPGDVDWYEAAKPPGELIYRGPTAAIIQESSAMWIDPETPEWIKKDLREFLPKLSEFFVAQFKGQPPRPLRYFFSASPSTDDVDLSGDAWGSGVRVTLDPGLLKKPNDSARARLKRFLAHATALQWMRLAEASPDQAWLRNGGAQALGVLALHHLKELSSDQTLGLVNDALWECEEVLKGRTFEQLNSQSCGVSVQWLAHAALMKQKSGADLFTLWSALLKKQDGRSAELAYSEWLAESARLGVSADLVDALRGPQASGALKQDWEKIGGKISSQGRPSTRAYQRTIGLNLLRALMTKDCNGHALMHRQGDRVELEALPGCDHLVQTVRIEKVAGLDPLHDGIRLFESLRKNCDSSGVLKVLVKDETSAASELELSCPDTIPDRPDPIQLSRLPVPF